MKRFRGYMLNDFMCCLYEWRFVYRRCSLIVASSNICILVYFHFEWAMNEIYIAQAIDTIIDHMGVEQYGLFCVGIVKNWFGHSQCLCIFVFQFIRFLLARNVCICHWRLECCARSVNLGILWLHMCFHEQFVLGALTSYLMQHFCLLIKATSRPCSDTALE